LANNHLLGPPTVRPWVECLPSKHEAPSPTKQEGNPSRGSQTTVRAEV
jgi:hypothetical protein